MNDKQNVDNDKEKIENAEVDKEEINQEIMKDETKEAPTDKTQCVESERVETMAIEANVGQMEKEEITEQPQTPETTQIVNTKLPTNNSLEPKKVMVLENKDILKRWFLTRVLNKK